MARALSSAMREGSTDVLRTTRTALQGREVGVWESDAQGKLRLIAASSDSELPRPGELEAAIHGFKLDKAGQRWVASRLNNGKWCAAPVRTKPAAPSPSGVERRGRERVTLELAGLSLGLLDDRTAVTRQRMRSAADAMVHNRARVGMIIEQVPAILWTTDHRLVVTSSSGATDDASAQDLPERITGQSLLEEYHHDRVSFESLDAHNRALAGEQVAYRFTRGGRAYDANVKPLRAESGEITGVVGIAMDVTDREKALEEARHSRAQLEDFFDNTVVGMHWLGGDGTILRANKAQLDLLGYAADEFVGRNIRDFAVDPDEVDDALKGQRAGETMNSREFRMRHKDGSMRYVLVSSNALFEDGEFVHTRSVMRDITERKDAEAQLRHGAMHDPLTDLPNRAFFIERLHQALDRARRDSGYRFAVLFLDFDNFKVVNDSLGHSVGDKLLEHIADRLRKCVRPQDMVARLGGDEFTLLLEEVAGPADVEQSTRRIQRCLNAPYMLDGREVVSTASIGVALSVEGFESPEEMLRDADVAMYKAKAMGRARFQIFDAGMRIGAQARFGIEMDLRHAIERGEFRLLFQPIVELETGRVYAFEALLRWHHSERGVIKPPDFIPVAEEMGLIEPIGKWCLREACWHARRWQSSGAGPVRMNVNVSAKQLRDPRIVADVREALKSEGLEPSRLRLEITESALMENVEQSVKLLHELRALGVEIHIDDFGTGYSSLAYLPRFPIQTIKIDRSFTHRMGLRRTDQEIVRSIVDLARNLDMGVVAEGVENVMQAERLIEFGCRLGQGFHFAQPLEASAALGMLQASAADRAITAHPRPV